MARNPVLRMVVQSRVEPDVEAPAAPALGRAAGSDRRARRQRPGTPVAASLALISYLNDSFPRMAVAGGRRDRLQRRLMHALRIPRAEAATGWGRLEAELNHRLSQVDPRWTPLVGGAALVLLGVLGVAV